MKILKEGIPAKAVISCSHCKCEMEYTNKDMHEEHIDLSNQNCITAWPTKRTIYFYISCPCCGEHMSVNKL